MTSRRACYNTEMSAPKYRLLTMSVQKRSVESFNNLVAHKIQQTLILFLCIFAPCILIQLSNIHQRYAHFSN
jgi:hypothetical protein